MTRRLLVALALSAAVGGGPRPAAAQTGAPLPGMMPGGTLLPAELGRCCEGYRVGLWVEYLVLLHDRREAWHLRLAVTGREGDAWWVEMTVAQARGGEAVARMLVRQGEGVGLGGRLLRLVVQAEGQIPLELPLEEASGTLPDLDAGEGASALVGSEQVRVRAGTFEARHYRRGAGRSARDAWISDRVPLWGLVRFHGPHAEMALTGMGTGAVSRITGDPVPFDPSTLR